MAEDYKKWTIDQLRSHLQQRALSVSRFRKDDLVKLAEFMDNIRLVPRPTAEEEKDRRAARLKEILSPSKTCNLPDPSSTTIDWSVSFSETPEINLLNIYEYFIQSPSPVYLLEQIKKYKSLAAYGNAASGFVQTVPAISKNLPGDWIFVKSEIAASQTAAKNYDVWVLMNKKGDIRACRCSCPAGIDEFCSHAACLLFYLLIINESGLNQKLPTGAVCKWSHLSTKKDSSERVRIGRSNKGDKPDFHGQFASPETTEDVMELVQKIAPDSRIVQARTSQIDEPAPPFPGEAVPTGQGPSLPQPPALLAAAFMDEQGGLAVEPLRFAAIVKHSVTDEQSKALEEFTREQGAVEEWSSHRWGRITASKANAVRTFMGPRGGFIQRKTPVSALKSICPASNGPDLKHKKSIRFGIENEQCAADAYMKEYGENHLGRLKLERVGLIVPVDDAHLGVSIDRLATCSCGQDGCKEKWIVEIKCPFSISQMGERSMQAAKKLSYLLCTPADGDDFDVNLRVSSSYFTQLQMQMAISGVLESELFIWTVDESKLKKRQDQEEKLKSWCFDPIPVQFDEPFWKQLKAKMDVFYQEYVAPLILTYALDTNDDID